MLNSGVDAHDLDVEWFGFAFGWDMPVWLYPETFEFKFLVNWLVERKFILEYFLTGINGGLFWIWFLLFSFFIELNFDAFLLWKIELTAIDEVFIFGKIRDRVHEFFLNIVGLKELGGRDGWEVLLGFVGGMNETVSLVEKFGKRLLGFMGFGVEKGLIEIVRVF